MSSCSLHCFKMELLYFKGTNELINKISAETHEFVMLKEYAH
jgi:hypothetical protein